MIRLKSNRNIAIYYLLVFSFFILNCIELDAQQTFNSNNDSKISQIRSHIISGIPDDLLLPDFERPAFRFADKSAVFVNGLFNSGHVYLNQKVYEDYINEVFERVLPEELKNDSLIRAYIIKDGSFNAFMTPSGITFLNIGMLANMPNEATLAGILAHELAHYHLRHSMHTFVKSEDGDFRTTILYQNKNASNFSVKNEFEADSLAFVWLKDAGYSIEGMLSSFDILNRMELNRIYRRIVPSRWNLPSHPQSQERYFKLTEFSINNALNDGALNLVNEELFKELKEFAKMETLDFFLDNYKYSQCLEHAFKYHLYEPENAVYYYYIMESIRRRCYLDPTIWGDFFITDRYYDISEDLQYMVKRGPLFENIPNDVFAISKNDIINLPGAFYWNGDSKFDTNEQAFEYFFQLAERFEEPECILSYALSTDYLAYQKVYLTEYLEFENVKHREYATTLLNGNIYTILPNKKMHVFSEFKAKIRQGEEEISIRCEYGNLDDQIKLLYDSLSLRYPNDINIYLPEWKRTDMQSYQQMLELERFSFIPTISTGAKAEAHILNPEIWEMFRKYEVNEIDFLNAYYLELRKTEETIGAYEEIIGMDVEDLYTQVKRSRTIEVLVTGVREIDNGVMKVRFYGGENKIKFKKPAFEEMVEILESILEAKDGKANELDLKYGK